MGSRLLKIVLSFLFLSLVQLAVALPAGNGAALADGPCNNGTHWDTITQSCR